jgi:hypothetical protein
MQTLHREFCPNSCVINRRFSHTYLKNACTKILTDRWTIQYDLTSTCTNKVLSSTGLQIPAEANIFLLLKKTRNTVGPPKFLKMSSTNYYCICNSMPHACLQNVYRNEFTSLLVSRIRFMSLALVRFEIVIGRTSRG